MSGLAEFLLARIAEDEETARAAYGVRWHVLEGVDASFVLVQPEEIRDNKLRLGHLGHVATVSHEHDFAHIARWDPARVLAECEAKRRIVERCLEAHADADYQPSSGSAELADDTLSLLALPYADHPDYDEAWRP